ncbi:unnamed protein product [Protopolystoma xenopodis]|uniref:Uncharacterized protein n=1 Tax=Protopolystoma xenopodis TaxID=117903 RepID=A0A3S4ZU18_9PLAT|nr:unnamed protein product [Protopolystoma xenopodis]
MDADDVIPFGSLKLGFIIFELSVRIRWCLGILQRLEELDHLAKKFHVKCATHEAWLAGKPEALASTDYLGASLTELRAMRKKHEAFLSDLGAHDARVDRIIAIAEELK